MAGHKRFRNGAWRLTADAEPDPFTGKRRQVHATVHEPDTRAGAKAAGRELAKLVLAAADGRAAPRSGVTVEQLTRRWVEHRRKAWEAKSPGQPDWTLRACERWVFPDIGKLRVEKVRPIDLYNMYDAWRAGTKGRKPLAEPSVRRYHNIVRSMLQQAVRLDMRVDNPAERLEPPSAANPPRDAPSDELLKAILNAAPVDYHCYLRLAAITGARRGQLVGARWGDIDLDGPTIRFSRAYANVKGAVAVKQTKTGVKNRLALDPRTVELLRAHRRRCAERALAAGVSLPHDAFVFPARGCVDGSRPWSPNAATKRWEALRAKVPGAGAVHAHDMRHWLATTLFADGHDPVEVAERGGWASAQTPLATYGHFRPARDQQAAADLAARLDN